MRTAITQTGRTVFVMLCLGLFGCNSLISATNPSVTSTSDDAIKNLPKVVATTSVLCDLTRQVARETINLTCLTPPDTNPHIYQPQPEARQALEQARLIFFHGYNLEPNILKLIRTTKSNAPKIAVGQRAVPNPLRSQQNGKAVADPYIWHDAKNAVKMVEVINTHLGKVLPENAAIYSSNAQAVKSELTQLDAWIRSRIASIPPRRRRLVTTQDVMGYYAKAYNLTYEPISEGVSTAEQPSTARVKTVGNYITQNKVTTMFTETTFDPTLTQSLTQQLKAKVSERKLFAHGLGTPESPGATYRKIMTANTRTIVEGLGGTYLIFEPKNQQKQKVSNS